jgi:hypothetical protein
MPIKSACVLVLYINNHVLPIVLNIESRAINELGGHTPSSLNHVACSCPFLDPHVTKNHSNIGFGSRKEVHD